jgi:hypothetical protein
MRWQLCFLSFVAAAQGPIHFENKALESGVKFVLENSATPLKHLVETMPGGVAVFDYNSDGRPDIFFTNGAALPSLEKNDTKFHNRLFRNDGNWKFTDVTEQAGLAGSGYSMGAAAADFDNDGYTDLFIAGVYRNQLYHNLGDGTFEDITQKSGINSNYWSVAAGWFDFNHDGLLDLFVVNYAKWTPAFDRFCGDEIRQIRIYCHPRYFQPVPNQLYRNLGGGRFREISNEVGLSRLPGRGMSAAFGDYDGDGFEDVFVANDKMENFLFHNRAGKSFEELALAAGVALPDDGRPISGMGVDFCDFNNDGLPDLILTALSGETFPLFRNLGLSQFRDATHSSKLASATRKYSGWSVGCADFDNDGWVDLFTANSHVNDLVEKFEPYHYRQPNTVFRNQQDGTFALADSGMALAEAAHRGSAFADFDGDGRVDVVVSVLGGPAELWRNLSPMQGAWLDIHLVGTKSNRDGMGARIRVGNQTRWKTSTAGYASSSHTPVHFGGLKEKADVEIRWPSGYQQTLKGVPTRRTVTIKEE